MSWTSLSLRCASTRLDVTDDTNLHNTSCCTRFRLSGEKVAQTRVSCFEVSTQSKCICFQISYGYAGPGANAPKHLVDISGHCYKSSTVTTTFCFFSVPVASRECLRALTFRSGTWHLSRLEFTIPGVPQPALARLLQLHRHPHQREYDCSTITWGCVFDLAVLITFSHTPSLLNLLHGSLTAPRGSSTLSAKDTQLNV